jgi:hypothetical protein
LIRAVALVALAVLVACGGSASEAETTPERSEVSSGSIVPIDGPGPVYPDGTPPVETTTDAAPETSGPSPATSMQAPLETCGPGPSYQAVSEWRCADGSMPLGGDAVRGRDARQGSGGSHIPPVSLMESHIVDIYRVPCPEGAVEVHVCMYHC